MSKEDVRRLALAAVHGDNDSFVVLQDLLLEMGETLTRDLLASMLDVPYRKKVLLALAQIDDRPVDRGFQDVLHTGMGLEPDFSGLGAAVQPTPRPTPPPETDVWHEMEIIDRLRARWNAEHR